MKNIPLQQDKNEVFFTVFCSDNLCSKIFVNMNFLFHRSTVSVDWSNTFMNVGANKIKYWRRKIAEFPLTGAKFLNY